MKEQLKKIGEKVDVLMENQDYVKRNLAEHIKRTNILQDHVTKTDERNQKYLDRFTKNFWAAVGVLITVLGLFEFMNH